MLEKEYFKPFADNKVGTQAIIWFKILFEGHSQGIKNRILSYLT